MGVELNNFSYLHPIPEIPAVIQILLRFNMTLFIVTLPLGRTFPALPSNMVSHVFKFCFLQYFCKDICYLLFCIDWSNMNSSLPTFS